MTKILVIHTDKTVRKYLEAMCSVHHQALSASDIKAGLKAILKHNPAAVLVGLDAKKKDALILMTYMKQYGATTPVIVVGDRRAGTVQLAALKAGAKSFVELPVDQARLNRELSKVLQADSNDHDSAPEITDEEKNANLSELERRLNRHMRCPSGRNQVHIHAMIQGLRKTKPRIALECPLRKEYGQKPTVYYEYIRDVCCSDPSACPAVQQFQAKSSA